MLVLGTVESSFWPYNAYHYLTGKGEQDEDKDKEVGQDPTPLGCEAAVRTAG
jgi:hypothetical protein